jgi:hypothetical protein
MTGAQARDVPGVYIWNQPPTNIGLADSNQSNHTPPSSGLATLSSTGSVNVVTRVSTASADVSMACPHFRPRRSGAPARIASLPNRRPTRHARGPRQRSAVLNSPSFFVIRMPSNFVTTFSRPRDDLSSLGDLETRDFAIPMVNAHVQPLSNGAAALRGKVEAGRDDVIGVGEALRAHRKTLGLAMSP